MKNIDWKKTLGTVAPALAAAFGGPLAGVAAGVIAKELGLGQGATEADIETAVLSATPDTLFRLKEANQQYELELERLGLEWHKVDAADRANARALGINTTLIPQMVLATIFTSGFILVLYTLFSGKDVISPLMMQPAMTVLGLLSAGLMQILNYFFGSNSGSMRKTDAMISALKG